MRTMGDLVGEWAATRSRLLAAVEEVRQQSVDFRHRIHDQLDQLDPSPGDDENDESVPAEAPAQYAAVRDQVRRGDFTWLDVLTGRVEDPAAQAVHLWADERVEAVREAFRRIESGVCVEEAVAAMDEGPAERRQ